MKSGIGKRVFFSVAAALLLAGPLTEKAISQSDVPTALEALKAGGKTIAGPGVFGRIPNIQEIAVQLTTPTNVCATAVLVSGEGMELNLLNAAQGLIQGATTNPTSGNRTISVCHDQAVNVAVKCTGATACRIVWRVDAR
ncbi:MAG: hypothetical protein FJW20_05970 [Acidimicrobiia bacterium]|nr:hypothetical protein [Acidimicrobiia bacterium]